MDPMRRILLLWACIFLVLPIPGSAAGAEHPLFPDLVISRVLREGQSLKISDFRGKPVLLSFWATWCHPCREELPKLIRTEQEIDGFVFLPIAVDSPPSSIRHFFKTQRLEHPVYGMSRKNLRTLGIRSLPSNLILDAQGKVVHATTGYSRDSVLKMRRILKRLIKQGGGAE